MTTPTKSFKPDNSTEATVGRPGVGNDEITNVVTAMLKDIGLNDMFDRLVTEEHSTGRRRIEIYNSIIIDGRDLQQPETVAGILAARFKLLGEDIMNSPMVSSEIKSLKRRQEETAQKLGKLLIENESLRKFETHYKLELDLRHGRQNLTIGEHHK